MDDRWLIIADDLTGAADSAIAFAKRRLPAWVSWGEPRAHRPQDGAVLAFDAGTRQLDAPAAARRHAHILGQLLEPGMRVFKKIDSTLRGHPAEEIRALVEVLATRHPELLTIFAPAFPAGGRVTRGGRVYVHGTPLERSEFWAETRSARDANLAALLESAGLRPLLVPIEAVRGESRLLRATFDRARGRREVCVCDAEESGDLDRIAAVALDGAPAFLAGSAGLAHALAARAARRADQRLAPIAHVATTRGALLVVGSQAGPSRAALESLATIDGLHRTSISAEQILGDGGGLPMSGLESTLAAGVDVVVDIAPPARGAAITAKVVDALACRIATLAPLASALMATGGDTAAALLGRCGVDGIRLVDELEPGTSLGLTLGALRVPVITKSGGFGDAGSLRRIVERLRFIRQTGTVA